MWEGKSARAQVHRVLKLVGVREGQFLVSQGLGTLGPRRGGGGMGGGKV